MPNYLRHPLAGLERLELETLRFRLVDAKDQVVGRLASQLAVILQGKDKPIFSNKQDNGDVCVVVNAAHVVFTGRKWDDKLYRWHSGYPGGMKEVKARDYWKRDPTEILREAVSGMLPKNHLRKHRMMKLRLFPGPEHAFKEFPLTPFQMPPRKLRDRRLGWQMPEGFQPMNPQAYDVRMRASRLKGLGPGQVITFQDLLTEEERELLVQQEAKEKGQQNGGGRQA